MKEAWWSAKTAELQEAADRKDSKAFFDGLKKVYDPQERGVMPILASDGRTLLTDKSDILKRLKQHFNSVLNSTSVIEDVVLSPIFQHSEMPELSLEPTQQEVMDSINQISSGKTPGN